jgi:O-glycosyl hydrolase
MKYLVSAFRRTLQLKLSILVAILFIQCQDKTNPEQSSDHLAISLELGLTEQTIHNFGASDAWSTQFVGANWPDTKKKQIAEWLFSEELNADGSPKGIALSAWRFNIGAGSAYQGGNSGINDEWRRAESFILESGEYNKAAHQGQRWFLREARAYGVETFIGFSNSPPIALTKNGKAYSSGGSWANLPSENHDDYAEFLVESINILEEEDGVMLDYISPFNEPQWSWDNSGQEGSPWQNEEIAAVTKQLNSKLQEANLNTKIEVPEAGQLNFLYQRNASSGRDNQIEAFFDAGSSNYIGNLSHVANKVAGHSYFTTWELTDMIDIRRNLRAAVSSQNDLEFWMTEYCALENNAEIEGNGRDLGMNLALYTARVIYSDLVVANANAWHWWLAVSPYDYKDGLVYIDNNTNDGEIYDSKTLWALGNFSRFVKPGATRVAVSRSDLRSVEQTLGGLMTIGFINPSGEKVAVIINYSDIDIPVRINTSEQDSSNWSQYRTSAISDENLKKLENYDSKKILEVPSRSITTLVQ